MLCCCICFFCNKTSWETLIEVLLIASNLATLFHRRQLKGLGLSCKHVVFHFMHIYLSSHQLLTTQQMIYCVNVIAC